MQRVLKMLFVVVATVAFLVAAPVTEAQHRIDHVLPRGRGRAIDKDCGRYGCRFS